MLITLDLLPVRYVVKLTVERPTAKVAYQKLSNISLSLIKLTL
ncbi:hypothetical protein RNAN_2649 [Rheinheimera nanhaiensis E407-8]|uniref:Uncharacterized protein n=1 Tax=Rheinheimera nanhaiensis E407-8 TaxID=562729 RepID=I1E015_9GAMM|nr:hypothetical protein RNAN_2649 [Rheinheimera nanhaiensis E407-8]